MVLGWGKGEERKMERSEKYDVEEDGIVEHTGVRFVRTIRRGTLKMKN
jgi:hypothetical protein